VAQAERDGNAAIRRLVATAPGSYAGGRFHLHVARLQDDLVRPVRPALLALFGAVGFVLLIACSNIAQLLLARGTGRARELAVRQAIGASRVRIARQLLTESLTLAALAIGAGLLLANWCVALLVRMAPASLPRRDAIGIDPAVLVFAVAAALLSTILFGLAPALQAMRTDAADALKSGGVRTGGVRAGRVRAVLVVTEVALSLMLMAGAALMLRTFTTLNRVPLGFRADRLLTANVPLTFRKFPDPASRTAFYQHALARVRALSGVESAGLVFPLALQGRQFFVRYGLESDAGVPGRTAASYTAAPAYFETMGIRLIGGRDFSWEDISQDRAVVIVDDSFARLAWPDGSAIGKRVTLATTSTQTRWAEVIGVTEHVQADGLRTAGLPQLYRPYQMAASNMNLVVRGRGDARALARAIKTAVEALGPGRPVRAIRTMNEYVADATAVARFALSALAAFALAAVLLSGIGLYGVIAYTSAGRTREIGIRIALGAPTSTIVRLVVGDGLSWTLAGIGVGLAGAAALTRSLETMLFGVGATDPVTFTLVALAMLVVAAMASYLPARRASRVDPAIALRVD
jgi:predicted permease